LSVDAGAEPPRLAWVGLDHGPLAPEAGAGLEHVLVEELEKAEGVHLVDAAGHALGAKALARESAQVAGLLEQGVDHFLHLRYEAALERIDRAVALFESQLVPLRDHDLLHDALMARAEAQSEHGQKELAKTTLKRLVALGPKRAPTGSTHRPPFLALWKEAKKSIGRPGRIEIETDTPGATIQLDGKTIGPSPAEAARVLPGTHYVAARWPGFVVTEAVQLGAGASKTVRVQRAGPAEIARAEAIAAVESRRGERVLAPLTAKLATIASSD
jgi:hypothetical protein